MRKVSISSPVSARNQLELTSRSNLRVIRAFFQFGKRPAGVIELLDGNGKVVGDLTDAIIDFGPGQIWNFEAGIVSDDAVAAAQVKEIKGWL